MAEFTHFNSEGRAYMVDVTDKDETDRMAIAKGEVKVSKETLDMIKSGGVKKGDVLTVAQVAGIMGAKRTSDTIPMCHPLPLSGVDISLSINEENSCVDITASVRTKSMTGVEMEALNAVSVAALTVYDMCKALQKDMVISNIHLVHKEGGVHGEYNCEKDQL